MAHANMRSRRQFLQTAAASAATSPYLMPAFALGASEKPGANNRIQGGLIGCGSMGRANLNNCAKYADVEVTGACDIWKGRRDAVVAQYPGAKPYHDYREMLQQDDIDAVIIGTPPHWHCFQAVDACKAGKDCHLDVAIELANLSMQVGRSIRFDPKTERILGDPAATKLATPEYRAPWRFPAEYVDG